MIKIEWVVYSIIALIAMGGIVWDVTRYVDNGYFSDKQPGDPGLATAAIVLVFASFSLIWGGIFWW